MRRLLGGRLTGAKGTGGENGLCDLNDRPIVRGEPVPHMNHQTQIIKFEEVGNMATIDLHMHSVISIDGELEPEEVIRRRIPGNQGRCPDRPQFGPGA